MSTLVEAGSGKRPRDSLDKEELENVAKIGRSTSSELHLNTDKPFMAQIDEKTTMFSFFLEDRLKEGKGSNVALIDARNGKKYTYSEVHKRSLAAAAVFREEGLQVEQRALLMLKNVPELVLAYWGVQALGSVVTMAVPWLGKRDLYSHFLQYTRSRIAVAPYSMLPLLRELVTEQRYLRTVFVVDDGEVDTKAGGYELKDVGSVKFIDFHNAVEGALQAKQHEDKTLIPPDLCKDDIALWYFTSGTTGLPKGCVHLQHDMCLAALTYGKITMQLRETDVTFTSSPMVGPYAMGSNCLFPFAVGAACLLDGKGKAMCADAMFDLIDKFDVTVGVTAPNLIRAMCESARKDASKARMGKQLRYVTSAGDVLYAADYHRWQAAFGVEVLDGIGTSELQHIFISNTLDVGGVKPGSVGRVVPGYKVRIVDGQGEVAQVGEVGELRIKADSNAIMYWNQHDKSKAVFLGDWYATGDLAYADADGFFFLCGRSSDLKSMFTDGRRDLRISPFRLEDELLTHPAVADCAVVDVANGIDDVQITAYLVLRGAADFDEQLQRELPAFLRQRVGELGSPLTLRAVPKIPRNARDKVERTLLRNLHYSVFCAADADQSEWVSKEELRRFLAAKDSDLHLGSAGIAALRTNYDALFDKYDADGNGRLTFPEFREMMTEHEPEILLGVAHARQAATSDNT